MLAAILTPTTVALSSTYAPVIRFNFTRAVLSEPFHRKSQHWSLYIAYTTSWLFLCKKAHLIARQLTSPGANVVSSRYKTIAQRLALVYEVSACGLATVPRGLVRLSVCVADIRRPLADLLEIASVNLCICRRAGLPTIPTRSCVAMETCYL